MNILGLLREQFSPELLEKISGHVGETPEATKSALDTTFQALLGSAASQASSSTGATSLFNLLKDKTPQGGWASFAGGLLNNLGGSGQGMGSAFTNLLLGSKLNAVRDFITSRSGVQGQSASSLLGIAGGLLMGFLGQQASAPGAGASSFGQLLRSQTTHLQQLGSPELNNLVGNVPGALKTAGETGARELAGAATSGARILRYAWIPLLLLLGVIFLAYRAHSPSNMGGISDETATTRSSASGNPLVKSDDFQERLKTLLADESGTPHDVPGLDFDQSGSLTPTAQGMLSSLANVLNSHPSIKAKVTVYGKTDPEAAGRANTVRAALMKAGVPEDRIAVESGVGESIPKISFMK